MPVSRPNPIAEFEGALPHMTHLEVARMVLALNKAGFVIIRRTDLRRLENQR